MPDGSSTAHLYRPKLVTTLLEGYNLDALRHDAVAGLFPSRQTRSVCAEIMLKRKDRAG